MSGRQRFAALLGLNGLLLRCAPPGMIRAVAAPTSQP